MTYNVFSGTLNLAQAMLKSMAPVKRLNVESRKQCHTIAHGFWFYDAK